MRQRRTSDFALIKRLLSHAGPYRALILGTFAFGLLATPLALLTPLPIKIAIDSILGSVPLPHYLDVVLPAGIAGSTTALLIFTAALLVAITLLRELHSLGQKILETYAGQKLNLKFRADIFQHVQRLALSYHDTVGSSHSLYRIQYDAPSIEYVTIRGLIPTATAIFKIVTIFGVMAAIDIELALIALLVSPPLVFLYRFYRQGLRSRWGDVKELESSAMSVLQESLGAIRVVKAFGKEDRQRDRFMTHSNESISARLRATWADGSYSVFMSLVTAGGTAAILFIGVRHVQSDVLTLGNLILIMSYLGELYRPLKTLGRQAGTLQAHLASAERVFAVLDADPEVHEKANAIALPRAVGRVEFRDVSFKYDRDSLVLRGVSLAVPAGCRVGIAGESGVGKTTFVSLLTRFYDPSDGAIMLDDVDLRDYRLKDLRNQFAIVLQEPVLFSGSIAENIAYGLEDANQDQVIEAARRANAHDFITALPEGYETLVGERGMKLSGGERQRIAVARAFLKDSPILILDEPTSSVDVKTEAVILEAMERLMEGRTTFMIAHRLTTLSNCDLLLFIEGGRVSQVSADVDKTLETIVSSARGDLVGER